MEDPNYNSEGTLPIDEPQEDVPSQSTEVTHLITHQDPAPKVLRLHRVNIIHDIVEQFKDTSVVEANLSFNFIDENGVNASGVARDAYPVFGKHSF